IRFARVHPVTGGARTGRLTIRPHPRPLVIPRCQEGASRADGKVGLPLGLSVVGVGVQLEWRGKGYAAVGGADVEDVGRVAVAGIAGIIDVMNYAVNGSW